MQHREVEPGCCNDEQKSSNPDISTAPVQHSESPRGGTSFDSSSLNDHESNDSDPAQVPYPHNMLVRPSYWSSALWRCSDDWPTCCITCLCPCITFGQIAKIADGRSCCCVYSAIYFLLSLICVQCLYSFVNRTKLRAKYSLPEHPFSDFCIHCCCEICALCQERREIKYRAGRMRDFTSNFNSGFTECVLSMEN